MSLVLKGADQKSILAMANEMEGLVKKSKERSIDIGDLRGGSFTVTSVGSIGGKFFTPVINYPEAAILGIGRIYDKIILKDGKTSVGKFMPLSLAFDHRVVDGAEAARAMKDLLHHLEDPNFTLSEA